MGKVVSVKVPVNVHTVCVTSYDHSQNAITSPNDVEGKASESITLLYLEATRSMESKENTKSDYPQIYMV